MRFLIQVKMVNGGRLTFPLVKRGAFAVPTQTAIAVAGVVLVFAVFAISLAWADYYTRGFKRPETAE